MIVDDDNGGGGGGGLGSMLAASVRIPPRYICGSPGFGLLPFPLLIGSHLPFGPPWLAFLGARTIAAHANATQ